MTATYTETGSTLTSVRGRSGVLSGIVRPGMRVLDIGPPGTGTETIPVLEMGAEVTAVDISAGMLTVLRSKAESRGPGLKAEVLKWPCRLCPLRPCGQGRDLRPRVFHVRSTELRARPPVGCAQHQGLPEGGWDVLHLCLQQVLPLRGHSIGAQDEGIEGC
ncbi:class I SAM-dependent methyltransferase [Thermogymnomonas acidicola]|uniref:class I SAM-dependent methyltransferase n=1 Tax=Thermogymnomonas acidicola TaxID=399579 RepID=UPI0009464774|nr:class I SAM-dependent methyltransferase [Thermogymnomonas acidicola]